MKKYLLSLAAMLMLAAPLALISCGDDDDDVSKPTILPVNLQDPNFKAIAKKIILQQLTSVNGNIIESIELTESGNYFIVAHPGDNARTRTLSDYVYLFGAYSSSGATFQLNGFGSITVDGDNVKANITITVPGSDPITVPVTLTKNEMEGLMATYLCRTWTISNTRLRYPNGGAVLAKDFPGECNLKSIVDFVKEYVSISDSFNPQKIVKGVTFTSAKTFLINYADNTYDYGSWNWVGTPSVELQTGAITYRWNEADMGASFLNGSASIAFSGSECKLTLKATYDGKAVEVVWTLR